MPATWRTNSVIASPPAGAAALNLKTNIWNFVPQLSDISYSNTGTTKLYSGIWPYGTIPDSSHFTLSNGFVAMNLTGTDGVVTINLATQMNNSLAGTLPYLGVGQSFYSEVTARLTSYTTDAHMAIWLFPQEHNPSLGDTLSIPPAPAGAVNYQGWGEIDQAESSFGTYEQALNTIYDHHGIFSNKAAVASASQTVANPGVFTTASQTYTAGMTVQITGTPPGGFATGQLYFVIAAGLTATSCQLSATASGAGIQCTSSSACTLQPGYFNAKTTDTDATPLIDFTIPHRFGASYNAAAAQVTFYVDDTQVAQYSTAAFDYEFNPYHWYQVMSCFTRGANTPYAMEIRNMTAWTP